MDEIFELLTERGDVVDEPPRFYDYSPGYFVIGFDDPDGLRTGERERLGVPKEDPHAIDAHCRALSTALQVPIVRWLSVVASAMF